MIYYRILTSVAPPVAFEGQHLPDFLAPEAVISSSMQRRPRFRSYYVSTTTIRIPTLTIRHTTIQKTIQLVADGNSAQLTCLPMGYSMCSS